jgi:hypothetical protein
MVHEIGAGDLVVADRCDAVELALVDGQVDEEVGILLAVVDLAVGLQVEHDRAAIEDGDHGVLGNAGLAVEGAVAFADFAHFGQCVIRPAHELPLPRASPTSAVCWRRPFLGRLLA